MRGIILFISILCFSNSLTNAKDNRVGIRLELFSYSLEKERNGSKYSNEVEFATLPGFYIFYSHQISENISLSVKPGFFFSGDGEFNGLDIGGYIKAFMSSYDLYLFSGINYVSLSKPEGGTSPTEIEINPYFLSLGVGYILDKHIRIDLGYYHNLNKRIGTSYLEQNSETQIEKPLNLYNLIKLSLEFGL